MAGIPFRARGTLFAQGERRAFLLWPEGKLHSLRLGFVLRGTEERILPETLLDDWGHEFRGTELYQWMSENAEHFPRAELFGFDLQGRPQQCFVRALDLTVRYSCYVFVDPSREAVNAGVQVEAILLPSDDAGHQQCKMAPESIPFPLRKADVAWWLVDRAAVGQPNYDFYRTLERDESD